MLFDILYVRMYVLCMYVCMYVCKYIRIHVCLYVIKAYTKMMENIAVYFYVIQQLLIRCAYDASMRHYKIN
jgi:hypothetical protein